MSGETNVKGPLVQGMWNPEIRQFQESEDEDRREHQEIQLRLVMPGDEGGESVVQRE